MKTISTSALQHKLETNEKLSLIDVREVTEVEQGHIPGIIHIPFNLLEFRMNELNKKEEYIIICRSGARSSRAVQFLESYGFNVTNMTGGMLDWQGKII